MTNESTNSERMLWRSEDFGSWITIHFACWLITETWRHYCSCTADEWQGTMSSLAWLQVSKPWIFAGRKDVSAPTPPPDLEYPLLRGFANRLVVGKWAPNRSFLRNRGMECHFGDQSPTSRHYCSIGLRSWECPQLFRSWCSSCQQSQFPVQTTDDPLIFLSGKTDDIHLFLCWSIFASPTQLPSLLRQLSYPTVAQSSRNFVVFVALPTFWVPWVPLPAYPPSLSIAVSLQSTPPSA